MMKKCIVVTASKHRFYWILLSFFSRNFTLMWCEKCTEVFVLFTLTIEMLKRTGCDYFNFNIQMCVPLFRFWLIREPVFAAGWGQCERENISVLCLLRWPFAKRMLAQDSEKDCSESSFYLQISLLVPLGVRSQGVTLQHKNQYSLATQDQDSSKILDWTTC